MTSNAVERVEQLEAAIAKDPQDLGLREDILMAYCADPEVLADPRRLQHIIWLVRHHPKSSIAQTPFAWLPAEVPEEAALAVEREWQLHIDAHPADRTMIRGLACFVADRGDGQRGLELLHEFIRLHGGDAALWLDVGRIETDARRQLEAFQQARAHGSDNSNLLHWTAMAAFQADAMPEAEATARELLARAAAARAKHGEAVEWLECGRDFWERASAITQNREEVFALASANSKHADDKHWGHTVLGLLAAKAGDIAAAAQHLQHSAAVSGGPRLSSYGPSMRLADALCACGEWEVVASYLKACGSFWKNECLADYLAEVEQHRVPEWDDRR